MNSQQSSLAPKYIPGTFKRELLASLLPSGITLDVCQSSESTSTALRVLAQNGATDRTMLVAEQQTGGHGRHGRPFFSPQGSGIYFSLLLRPPEGLEVTLITPAAAVATAEACDAVFGVSAQIKWVNDIFVNERKVAGLLAEAVAGDDFCVVLGIGTNISPPDGGFPPEFPQAGAITSTPPLDARERYVAETVTRFLRYYEKLGDREYFSPYRERLILKNRRVEVIAGSATYHATAIDIDDDFRLIVRHDDGELKHLSFGEVSIKL